jgi:hypothetical protein
MDMLNKLAAPVSGSILMHCKEETDYHRQLKFENSRVSQLIAQIVTNAQLAPDDVKELNEAAIKKNNFEFVTRLNACVGVQSKFTRREEEKDGRGGERHL